MSSFRYVIASTLAMFSMLALPCHAEEMVTDAAPVAQAAQGVPLLSGGVGDDEIEAIKNVKDYNVKFLFTESTGAYLSDLTVVIAKDGQAIANTITQGPVLFAKLPAGDYHVTASVSGHTQEKKIKVSAKGRTNIHVMFPMHDSVD